MTFQDDYLNDPNRPEGRGIKPQEIKDWGAGVKPVRH